MRFFFHFIMVMFIVACTKNITNNNVPAGSKPTLTTNVVTNIGDFSATSGGYISSDGSAAITSKGVCWSTNHNPTISDSKTTDGTGNSDFNSIITNLVVNTTYYVRAYATNSAGTGYGNEVTFITTANLPTVILNPISNISNTSATASGYVDNNGGSSITETGFKISTLPNSSSGQTISAGTTSSSFSKLLSSLNPNTTYYVKAYAINSFGTAYSSERAFTTTLAPVYINFNGNYKGQHQIFLGTINPGLAPLIDTLNINSALGSSNINLYSRLLGRNLSGTVNPTTGDIQLDSVIFSPYDTLRFPSTIVPSGIVKIWNVRAGGNGTITATDANTLLNIAKGNSNITSPINLTNLAGIGLNLKGSFQKY